ncbi:PREDICTED: uncharacterized protein LOC105556128, partial [Vollenhovia emeryi]|uniref:uncharacterized protein LOC105556128 n=1 Tax=Vollenhovia emeryi TaxID=411798 RepID=UPI0005F421E5
MSDSHRRKKSRSPSKRKEKSRHHRHSREHARSERRDRSRPRGYGRSHTRDHSPVRSRSRSRAPEGGSILAELHPQLVAQISELCRNFRNTSPGEVIPPTTNPSVQAHSEQQPPKDTPVPTNRGDAPDFARSTVQTGLPENLRRELLQKYEVRGDLAALGPPKINKLLLPALKSSSSTMKRDEYQAERQAQLAAALNAIGCGTSTLLKPEVLDCLPEEGKLAIRQISEGIRLNADLQYRLSIARRAFIKPTLTLLGKSTADSAPVDEWLFGSSFADEIKDAQACEKVARGLVKTTPVAPKATSQQPKRFQPQAAPTTSGNAKAPTRSRFHSRAGAQKSSGGMRFILNLKELNSYMDPPHFKLEDWRTVVRLMLPDFEMSSIDLEDAYLVVPIHPSYRKFLRFQWRGTTYEWAALPFGLATAPYIFSKILRPAIKLLRSQGFDSVVYLDDFLLLASSKPACRDNVRAHLKLLGDLGFVINYSKSELEPSRQRKFLGFIFNSEQQSVSIPNDRRRKLFSLVAKFSPGSTCTIRDFASMIGSLVSICPAVQYGLLYTKSFKREKFYNLISAENNYAAKMTISNSLKKDYLWWLTILSDNYQTNHIRSGPYACEIFTDASLSGWGASCSLQRTHGWWSETDKSRHINYLELKAVFYALKCFAKDLSDCDILLRVDNTTAISYINKFGSVQHPHLSSLAKEIWQWCEARNLFLFASYIASGDNVIADEESRQQVPDTEWSLSSRAFNSILREYGPFDIDLFASVLNAKCSIYVSWFPDP